MKIFARSTLSPLAAAIALAAPSVVCAQLEEIIVTAERRETAELTTAISIEVFTPEQLSLDKLQTVDDLQQMIPNFTVNNQFFNVQSVNIRGVGNAVGDPNIIPGVAVMQDGMIMGETVVIDQAFLDVSTIEVLRGPQGTFVGQSSTGGAVMINARRPDFDGVNGWVEARFGDYQDSKLSGAINLPVSDTIATRFAFSQEERESFYENSFLAQSGVPTFENGPHPGDTENQNFRASVLWEPSDSFSVLARLELNTARRGHTAPYQPNPRNYVNPNDPTGLGQSTYASFVDPNPDPYTLAYDAFTNFDSVSNRYSLEVSKIFDSGIEFISRTGYQYNDLRSVEDGDRTTVNASVVRIQVGPDNDYWTQEFNLISPDNNRLSWLVGTAWYHRYTPVNLSIDNTSCGYRPTTGLIDPCPTAPQLPGVAVRGLRETVQRHGGLFGQILYDISDNWELQIGARNSWDNNLSQNEIYVGVFGVPPFLFSDCASEAATRAMPADTGFLCIDPSGDNRSKFKDEEPTYKMGLNWTPGDEHFIYMFYARGYKSGAVDGGVRFENETVDDYEFGYKGTLLDGRLQIQTGIFYMDYQDMQQDAFVVHTRSDDDIFSGNDIINIGESTIEGFEFEMNSRFGNLGFNLGLGYTSSDLGSLRTIDQRFLDPALNVQGLGWVPGCEPGEAVTPDFFGPGAPSCFDYFGSPAAVDLSGAQNVFSPELSYNFSLDYTFETDAGGVVRPRISYSYTDSAFSSLFQSDNYFAVEERETVNVSISYERDEWTMRVYCNNCTDEATITSAGGSILYSPPRTAGVTFRYDF